MTDTSRGNVWCIAKSLTRPSAFILAYVLIGIMTFGHSASNYECKPELLHTSCKIGAAFEAGYAALFWPFYWSWEFYGRHDQ